jgi:LysM repeat protein
MGKRRIIIIGAGVLLGITFLVTSSKKKPVALEDTTPVAKITAQELYNEAADLSKDRKMLEAKETYQRILSEFPDYKHIENVQKELEGVNIEIIFSNTPAPQAVMHEVISGDTLGKLAKKYGTTIDLIKISNHLKSNIIRIGQRLRIWTRPFNIFIDKSQNKLILKDGEDVVKVYSVSTGENNGTPVGAFKIVTKLIDPVWFNKGVVVHPDSPQNVLGTRWLGFDLPGYGIHGTIEPDTIGRQVTAGCVRMKNGDVEELYNILVIGTKVVIVD